MEQFGVQKPFLHCLNISHGSICLVWNFDSRYTGSGTKINYINIYLVDGMACPNWLAREIDSFNFQWILQRTKSFETTNAAFEFILVDIFAKNRLWSGQCHLLHVLMLWSNGKSIHVHRNRHHNFICARAIVAAGTATHAMRRQTGFHPFPFCTTILEPDFYLQCLRWENLFEKFLNEVSNAITWTSLSFRLVAIWLRSVRLRYFFAWNSRSNSNNCSDVNAVRRRRDLRLCFVCVLFDSFVFSSPEHSLSEWSGKMKGKSFFQSKFLYRGATSSWRNNLNFLGMKWRWESRPTDIEFFTELLRAREIGSAQQRDYLEYSRRLVRYLHCIHYCNHCLSHLYRRCRCPPDSPDSLVHCHNCLGSLICGHWNCSHWMTCCDHEADRYFHRHCNDAQGNRCSWHHFYRTHCRSLVFHLFSDHVNHRHKNTVPIVGVDAPDALVRRLHRVHSNYRIAFPKSFLSNRRDLLRRPTNPTIAPTISCAA